MGKTKCNNKADMNIKIEYQDGTTNTEIEIQIGLWNIITLIGKEAEITKEIDSNGTMKILGQGEINKVGTRAINLTNLIELIE